MKKVMKSVNFLERAIDIQKERGAEYEQDTGERSFEKLAIIFNAKTGKDITAAEVALLLQDLKDVRQWSQDKYHKDSVEDCVSYASLKAEMLFKQYHP